MANHPMEVQAPDPRPPARAAGSILMRVSPLLLLVVLEAACGDAAYPSGAFAQDPQRALVAPPPRFPPAVVDINFESYSSTAELMTDCVTFSCVYDVQGAAAGGTGTVELDTTVAPPIPGLTKSMRYSYLHPGDGCNSITLERAVSFPAAQEAWGEFHVRWSSNFRTTNNGCPPNDHKLIFGDTENDLSGRWAFYVGADSGPAHTLMVERPMDPDERPSHAIGAYYLNRNRNPEIKAVDLWDGEWHIVRLYFRNSTTTSSGDGVIKIWIDGRLLHDERGFNTAKDGGDPSIATRNAEFINGFSFSHNKDDGPPGVLMHLWWGQIRVWTVNPGWSD